MAIGLRRRPTPAADPKVEAPQPEVQLPQEPEASPRVPHRAFRRGMVRLITRTNAAHMALVVLISIVAVIFLLSLFRSSGGSFTISLARADMYKYGIELSESSDFGDPAARLEATSLRRATNISVNDLPPGLDQQDGSHNGTNYIAYTFYVRNNGTTDFDYRYRIDVVDVTRSLDTAVRVAVYYNGGEPEVFAKRAADGGAEPDTVPFVSDDVIDSGSILDMAVGSVDKYTVVIWIEGDDPECVDDLLGGTMKMSMTIEVEPEEDET